MGWSKRFRRSLTEPIEPEPMVAVEAATDAIRGTECGDPDDYPKCVGFEEGKHAAIDALVDVAFQEGTD